MAYTDTTPRSVIQGWGPDRVSLSTPVLEGDLLGISADTTPVWTLAQATGTAILAMWIAGQDGDVDDEITVFRMAVVEAEFDSAETESGAALYLSNTPGDTSLATGTTTQVVGWVSNVGTLGRTMLNPRNPLALDGSDIANDSIDSAHYAAGSIDLEHMSVNSIDSDQYVDGSIDLVHMSVESIDSDQYVDGSIDTAHIAADQIDDTLIADDVIDSEHYAASSIDKEHLADEIIATMALTIPAYLTAEGSGDDIEVFSPVTGTVVAVQFSNESGGAFATEAALFVKGWATACATTVATLADGAVVRKSLATTAFATVSAGSTITFAAGEGTVGDGQTCIVEIDYILGDQ